MYKKLINPTEKKVNEILDEGYYIHSIIPVIVGYDKLFSKVKTDLYYHFIKHPEINFDIAVDGLVSKDEIYNALKQDDYDGLY